MKIDDKVKAEMAKAYRFLKTFVDGTTIAIHRLREVVDHPFWRVNTGGGKVAGLTGLAVAREEAFHSRFYIRVPKMVRRLEHGFLEARLMDTEAIAERRLNKLADIVKARFEPSHPDRMGQTAEIPIRTSKDGLKVWDVWQVSKSGPFKAPSVESPEVAGYEDELLAYDMIVTVRSKRDIFETLIRRKVLPDVEVSDSLMGKFGKYLHHPGVPVGLYRFVRVAEKFDNNPYTDGEDGQAYISLRHLPKFRRQVVKWYRRAEDPELKSMLGKVLATIRKSPEDTPVVIKGWTAGVAFFGKGNLVFVPEDHFRSLSGMGSKRGTFPVVIVDDNWVKMSRKEGLDMEVQSLMLHNIGKFGAENRDVGMSLVDRAYPFQSAFVALSDRFHQNFEEIVTKVEEEGTSWLTNQALGNECEIQFEGRYLSGDVNRAQDARTKALVRKIFTANVRGLYLTAVASWCSQVEPNRDEVLLNPMHEKTVGSHAMVSRYPLLGPAGSKLLKVRYSPLVPINGAIVSSEHMGDMGMDFDGDSLSILPSSDPLIRALWLSRPFNVTVPFQLKGIEGEARPTSRLRAILRGWIAKVATGLADTALSVKIAEAFPWGDRDVYAGLPESDRRKLAMEGLISNCRKEMEFLQKLLDTIKKPGAHLQNIVTRVMDPRWRLSREHHDAVVRVLDLIERKRNRRGSTVNWPSLSSVFSVAETVSRWIDTTIWDATDIPADECTPSTDRAFIRKMKALARDVRDLSSLKQGFYRAESGKWLQEEGFRKFRIHFDNAFIAILRGYVKNWNPNALVTLARRAQIHVGGRDGYRLVSELAAIFPWIKMHAGSSMLTVDYAVERTPLLLPAPTPDETDDDGIVSFPGQE